MKLAEWSVKNSLLVNLLTAFIIVAGLFAVFKLRREAFPNFSFDIVQIETRYPGATPSQVEKLITIPIEKELKEVDDIKETYSSSSEGFSIIYLTLEPDAKNKDKVINDIQRAVDRVDDFPADLKDKPLVEEISTKNTPLLEVSLFGQVAPEVLRQESRRLETALLDDPNVAGVVRRGYREPEISVEVDPKKLTLYQISLPEVVRALASTNINIPGGTVEEGNKEYILRVSGEFFTPAQVEDVIVRSNDQGNAVKIRDLAKVIPTLEEATFSNRTDGTDSINLMVLKKEKGDVLDLVKDVNQIIADFLSNSPSGLKITVVNDVSIYVQRRLGVLINNGLIGLGLVMICMVVFLSPRTALGAFIGIPTAILATFAMMNFFGITINLMSLFGMIMVVGMLVDEDIVIAENIHRLMEEGVPPKQAAIQGTSQVLSSVVATVLTTITAFIPLLLMGGIIGKFVKQIPQVVIITLTASLIQALLILPSHMADLNHMSDEEFKAKLQKKSSKPGMVARLIQSYGRSLRFLIHHRYTTTFLFILAMVGCGALAIKKIPFILFPNKGIEQFFIRAEAPVGTPIAVTTQRMAAIEKIIAELPAKELDHYVTQGGIQQNDPTDPFTQRSSNLGQVWVFLTPEEGRRRSAEEIVDSIRPQLKNIPGMDKITVEWVRPGPPVGKPISVHIRGDDFATLDKVAQRFLPYLNSLPGVQDVRSDYQLGKDELRAVIDEELLKQAGLSYQDVAAAIRIAFDGGVATTIKESDEEIDVVVRFAAEVRENKETLKDLLISNPNGRLIPLKAIAAFERHDSLAAINHDERKRVITVSGNVDEQVTTSQKVNAQLAAHFDKISAEFPGVLIKYGGEEEDTQESLRNLAQAFVLALFLTFIIIAATFRSLWEPLVIMTTIPMGMMGVIIAFYFFKEPLTFLSTLGIIGFAGVVVDGAILMVDFINHEKRNGRNFTDAIVIGSMARFRPILLTTLTTVLGVFPAAFGIGGLDVFIQPMALAMNWGLTLGTLMAIFLIPVFLAILNDAVTGVRRHVLRQPISRQQETG